MRVGRLGSFNVTLKSAGKDTLEEVTATDIVKGRVPFDQAKNSA